MKNIVGEAGKTIFLDLVGEILYFPLWWYSAGLKRTALYVFNSLKTTAFNLALPAMIRNLFRPMFGQSDRQGRAISFFMRIILLITRLVAFIVLAILNLLILALWIVLPILVVWGLKENFTSLWKR